MNEEKKLIIWSTDEYFNDTDINNWWQHRLEYEDDETDIRDVAGVLGAKVDDLNEEQKQALETLLPLYKAKQMKREPDMEWWYDTVNMWLDDERSNLDKKVDGTIICVADLGRWDGRRTGIKEIGENIKDILYSDEDSVTWYSDGKDIRCDCADHDGSSHYLYRVADDYETYEKLESLAYRGELTFEKVIKATKSLHPYVAEVYGWDIEEAEKVA